MLSHSLGKQHVHYGVSADGHLVKWNFHDFLSVASDIFASKLKKYSRYKYVDMSVNSLTLLLMIVSYAVIIYKVFFYGEYICWRYKFFYFIQISQVRESGRAMAKYQLTIRTRVSALYLIG